MHHDPQYYLIRNHLIDFLVNRASAMASGAEPKPAKPRVVRPGLEAVASVASEPAPAAPPTPGAPRLQQVA
jgi:nitrate/nitrite transport system ATP-binding protein